MISLFSQANTVLRSGQVGEPGRYYPLSASPPRLMASDPNIGGSGLAELGIVLAVVGYGVKQRDWQVRCSPDDPQGGLLEITVHNRASRVFVVRDASVLGKLEASGAVDPSTGPVVVACGHALPPSSRRSTGKGLPRRLEPEETIREVNVGELLREVTGPESLIDLFIEQGALV